MKIKLINKTGLTFGDFVTAAYQNCGARRAANFVQLAIHSRQVVFQKQPANQLSGLMGRIKIGPGVALLAVLLGCAGFVNAGYSQIIVRPPRIEVVVPAPPIFVAPPIVVEPDPGFFLYGGSYGHGYYGRQDAHDFGRRGAESRGKEHHEGGDRKR
jgi:hypothetical protein